MPAIRTVTYGREYQPNTLKRKRSYGFLARLKSYNGRRILKRRMLKGRKFLTH
ncbi:ribosomal protein L34 [Globomyces pollinis-pini]|nr:ribosomal protein L34 [Globomyces pollinis-pini]